MAIDVRTFDGDPRAELTFSQSVDPRLQPFQAGGEAPHERIGGDRDGGGR